MQLGPGTASLACARLIVPFAPFNEDFKMILLTSLPASWSPIITTCIKDGTSTEAISLLGTCSLHFSPKSSINPVAALQVTKPP